MPADVTVFGAPYSTYVRAVRLALEEKGVPYRLEEIDILSEEGLPKEYYKRQPFGRIPAFEHDGFQLFETAAINHYVDEVFDGPSLVPDDAKARARMRQIVGLLDSYGYRAIVWDVFVQRTLVPQQGGTSDEEKVTGGLKTAEICMATMEEVMGENEFLTGPQVTLADLHAYPIFCYFRMTQDGAEALNKHPKLSAWCERMAKRDSVRATLSPLEG